MSKYNPLVLNLFHGFGKTQLVLCKKGIMKIRLLQSVVGKTAFSCLSMWGGVYTHVWGSVGVHARVGVGANACVCHCIVSGVCVEIGEQMSEASSLSAMCSGGRIQVVGIDVMRDSDCLGLGRKKRIIIHSIITRT